MKETKIDNIERLVKEVCEKNHVALYDLNLKNTKKGRVLSVEITKIGGVSIDDCEIVSRKLSEYLDDLDLISGKYFLEVSSPGLERYLTQKKHYISAINEKIKVTYKKDDKTETVVGVLIEVLPDEITLKNNEEIKKINFKDIKKAKIVFEFKK